MKVGDLEDKLGQFQAVYTPNLGKIVVNIVLLLIWLFLGWLVIDLLWGFYQARMGAVAAGLIILIPGLFLLIIPTYQKVGRKVYLHEEGVWLRIRGKTQQWRFDQIDGVRVIAGQGTKLAEGLFQGIPGALLQGGLLGGGLLGAFLIGALAGAIKVAAPVDELVGEDINGYEFFVGGQLAFKIGSDYKQWQALGAAILMRVLNQLIPRLVGRLAGEERLVFANLTSDGLGQTHLTLSQVGIQEKEKAPIRWTDILEVSTEKRAGFATVVTLNQNQNIVFGVDGALNAYVALLVLKAMAKRAWANDTLPEVRDWPELKAATQIKVAQIANMGGSGLPWAAPTAKNFQDTVSQREFREVIGKWKPMIGGLLEQVANATLWGNNLRSDFGTSKPLGMAIRSNNGNITWEVGGSLAFASYECFIVTLALNESFEPVNFIVDSKTLRLNVEPGVAALKDALVRAYLDGPKIN